MSGALKMYFYMVFFSLAMIGAILLALDARADEVPPYLKYEGPGPFAVDPYGQHLPYPDPKKRRERCEREEAIMSDDCAALFLKDIRDILKEKK